MLKSEKVQGQFFVLSCNHCGSNTIIDDGNKGKKPVFCPICGSALTDRSEVEVYENDTTVFTRAKEKQIAKSSATTCKRISAEMDIELYKIEFEYMTRRGNWKKQLWEVPGYDERDAMIKLKSYIKVKNLEAEHKEYLNVNILRTEFVRSERIAI